jgi:hypothetical protein
MITITRCFHNAAALAVLCCALAWSVTVASAEDRVLAHWDMSSPDADARIIPGTANSEAGDLNFTAASTATIEKDAAAPGGQALVFPKAEPGGKSTNKVSITGDFKVEFLVKVSPDNKSEKSLTIVYSSFLRLAYFNGKIGFNVSYDDGYDGILHPIGPDQWSTVTASVEGGRITLSVDGDTVEKSLPPDAKLNGEENLITVGGLVGSIAKLVVTAK